MVNMRYFLILVIVSSIILQIVNTTKKKLFSCHKLRFIKEFKLTQPSLILINHTSEYLANDFLCVLLLAKHLYMQSGIKSAIITGWKNLSVFNQKMPFRFIANFAPHYLHIIYGSNRTEKSIELLKSRHVIMFSVSSSKNSYNNPNYHTGCFWVAQSAQIPIYLYGIKYLPRENTITLKKLSSIRIENYKKPDDFIQKITRTFEKYTKSNYISFKR